MRQIRTLSILLAAVGLLWSGAAPAVPYDTLRSKAGARNLFTDGNPGIATAPFLETGPSGNAAAILVDGTPVDANGIPGPTAMIVGDEAVPTVAAIGAVETIGRVGASDDFVTATTQVHTRAYWFVLRDSQDGDAPTGVLDSYGSSSDIADAALAGGAKVSTSDGVVAAPLTNDGLNVVSLADPTATATGIRVSTSGTTAPTGLIVNVGGDGLNFTDGSSDLGPLSADQILFNFGGATTVALRALAPEAQTLAPLAAGHMANGDVEPMLVIRDYGTGPKDRFLAFNDPFSTATLLSSEGTQQTATPEPTSLALFAVGLSLLALLTRGRRTRTP
jgi:choice-of-anchor A domain-containing protein